MSHARGVASIAAALAVLWTAGAAGCGGGTHPGPAGGPTGGSGPSGGGGDGSGSGGTSNPGGSGGGSDAGGGMGGGGGSAGGGTGGSAGSSPCDGLMATPDAGRAVRLAPSIRVCWNATTSPGGQLALGIYGPDVGYALYPPDGSAQQGMIDDVHPVAGTGTDAYFHATSGGWAAIVRDSTGAFLLRSFDTAGGTLSTTRDHVKASAPTADGGSAALARQEVPTGTAVLGPPMLEWLDGGGQQLRTATLDADPGLLLVDWLTGHVLTLVIGGSVVRARWYDGTGAPLTPWFDAGAFAPASLHLLVDGSVAVADYGRWQGVFRDGVAAMDPPPAWLAARPGTRLATIRNGRGYAVFGTLAGPGDLSHLEIVAATGESCGTVTLPAPSADPGVSRATMSIDVGQDGTVLLTDSLGGGSPGGGLVTCEFRYWRALLR